MIRAMHRLYLRRKLMWAERYAELAKADMEQAVMQRAFYLREAMILRCELIDAEHGRVELNINR